MHARNSPQLDPPSCTALVHSTPVSLKFSRFAPHSQPVPSSMTQKNHQLHFNNREKFDCPVCLLRTLGVTVGKSTITPGRFTFFRSPSIAVFSHRATTVPLSGLQDTTVSVMLPSAHRMVCTTQGNVSAAAKCAQRFDRRMILTSSRGLSNDLPRGPLECTQRL